jgi:hypothetical protein
MTTKRTHEYVSPTVSLSRVLDDCLGAGGWPLEGDGEVPRRSPSLAKPKALRLRHTTQPVALDEIGIRNRLVERDHPTGPKDPIQGPEARFPIGDLSEDTYQRCDVETRGMKLMRKQTTGPRPAGEGSTR